MKPIASLVAEYLPDAIQLRRRLHAAPELSMQEIHTTSLLKETLTEYGLSVLDDLPLSSGAAALLDSGRPGKTLLLRADIDALPMQETSGLDFASQVSGVCHSCGHDIHTAALLLCARVLSQCRQQLTGRVLFLFQPGEETGQGAQAVLQSGLLHRYPPDLVVGLHCWPDLPGGTVGLRKGGFMASADTVRIRVLGKGGHGAHPHKSVDPIVAASYLVTQLQTLVSRGTAPLDSVVVTIGKFIAGTAANIIPDEALLEGTIRTVSQESRAAIQQRLTELAEYCAASFGAKCEVAFQPGIPALVCTPKVVDQLAQATAQQLGIEQVHWLEQPSMGSEDFARYLELAPGAMFRIGTGGDAPSSRLPLHNSGIVFDEQAISTGAAVFSQTAWNFLQG